MNNSILYKLKNISFNYKLGSHLVEALKNVSLEIKKESLITFSGPSGSGKSTLLNLLGLIEPVQSGELYFEERLLSAMKEKEINAIRKYKIGFIFQGFHLIPVFSAEENVSFFLAKQKLPKAEIRERSKEALEAVGLYEHRYKKPNEMSGGQRQRVAIARALAKRPDVIIADEPTASLDQKNGQEVMEIFSRLVRENHVSIILTTHDPMNQAYASKNYTIKDGSLLT